MIKTEPQWFQLTTGNHRDDQTNRSPDRSRFPVFKTRPSSTSYASHSPTPFWTNKLTVSQFQLRSDESVWVLQHQRDPLIVSRPFVPSPWWGESTRGISAKKTSKSIQSILSLLNAESSLNKNWTVDRRFCMFHNWVVHPNCVVDRFWCSPQTTRGRHRIVAPDWPRALTNKWRFIDCWSLFCKSVHHFLQTGCFLSRFASFRSKRYNFAN